MFEVVAIRSQQQSNSSRSDRCRKIILAWIPVSGIIAILFVFMGHLPASLISFIIVLFMASFSLFYYCSDLPATGPDEASRAAQTGLSQSIIKEIPTFTYQHNRNDLNSCNGCDPSGLRCAVCIATVRDGDLVKQLLMCKHVFHTNCIDTWLPSHPTCPMCPADVKTGKKMSEQLEPPPV